MTPAYISHYILIINCETSTLYALSHWCRRERTAGTIVTVNSVLAGPTWSEGVEGFVSQMAESRGVEPFVVEKEFFETVRPSSLLKRFATAEEVAALVAFVARPLSSATDDAATARDGGVVRSII